MKYLKPILILAIFTLTFQFCANLSYSKSSNFGVSGGLLIPIGDFYDVGYSLGGNGFFQVSKITYIGGRISYNYLPKNATEKGYEYSGGTSIIEVAPTVRIFPIENTKMFLEAGTGLFFEHTEWTTIYEGPDYSETNTNYGDGNYFFLNFGVGLKIGNQKKLHFEIFPLIYIILSDEATAEVAYISLNAGISF